MSIVAKFKVALEHPLYQKYFKWLDLAIIVGLVALCILYIQRGEDYVTYIKPST
jgi:hypothetical protein